MFKILNGKKVITVNAFEESFSCFKRVEIDIGTGDGRFIYTQAKKNPEIFYIGIDTVAENMLEYASKSAQKLTKGGVRNVAYVIAAVENLPEELSNLANKIYITLPWGSLLEGIVKGDSGILENVANIAKQQAEFEFLITYDVFHEATEIVKRELPIITPDYIKDGLAERFSACGLILEEVHTLSEKDLRAYPTTWAKKLGFGRTREVFVLKGTIDSKRG